ncbi:MAG: PorV/PorQ family protein [Elusimicrobiales bacterium]|nr:PorV/PorQ family protein [Elusimicrobiales bacterium]
MKLLAAILMILASAQGVLGGDFGSGAKGTTGAAFLTMGMGARAVGMGGAYSAVAADASAVSWNPAGLVRAPEFSAMLMHASYLADISFDYLSFAKSNGSVALGGSLSFMNGGPVDHTDASGASLGQYQPRNYAANFSLAADLEVIGAEKGAFSAGVTAKYISSTLIESASAMAFDAGLSAKTELTGRTLRLAFVAQNLGAGMKFDKESDPLPLTFKAGGALNLAKDWLISADVVAPRGNMPYLCSGVEHTAYNAGNMRVLLRFGANNYTMGDISGISGISGGLGVVIKNMAVDYAIVPFGDLGLTHRLSLTMKFGGARNDVVARVKPYGQRVAKNNTGSASLAYLFK